jgi:hypothetical protein
MAAMRHWAQLGTTLALLAASAASSPATVQACSPPLEVQALFPEGASIPADGVLAFQTGWAWQLDHLLDDDEPLPVDGSYFHVRDVIRVESATGQAVPGTLEQVEGVVFFRPASALEVGSYTVHYKQDRLDTWELMQSFVVASGEPVLPSVEAVAEHLVIAGDYAPCEGGEADSCGDVVDRLALSDVDAARYAVRQHFSADAMRYQLLTRVTSSAQPQTCVGCDDLVVAVETESRAAVTMTVELVDLRSGGVEAEQLAVSYDGPFGKRPRQLGREDFLATDCIAPPEGLTEAWCDAFQPQCEANFDLCDNLPKVCGDEPPDDDGETDDGETTDGVAVDDGVDEATDFPDSDDTSDDAEPETKIGSARGCSIAPAQSADSPLAWSFGWLIAATGAWRIRRRGR